MTKSPQNEAVILLHGVLRSKFSLLKIALALKREGYFVYNLDYKSRGRSIANIADELLPILLKVQAQHVKFHVVCHSMGGLVLRHACALSDELMPHHVVMIATPNNGSPIADLLKKNFLYKLLYGSCGQQLTTNYKHPTLRNMNRVGVVAGTRSYTPFSDIIFKGTSDGTVSAASTKLEQMHDYIEIPASHSGLLLSSSVCKAVLHFVRTGRFLPPSP